MTIIDSANMQCDSCKVTANHPIMFMPDGWTVDRSGKSIQHLCNICSVNINLIGEPAMNRRSTDFQAIPVVNDLPSNTIALHIDEAGSNYYKAYMSALVEFEDFVVQSIQDAAKLDQLTNDTIILFRRYLTARIDYKMYTSPIDRSVQ